MAQQGHYAGAVSRLLAYGADLLILTTVYAAALALLQFAINAATPWSVDLKTAHTVSSSRGSCSGLRSTSATRGSSSLARPG